MIGNVELDILHRSPGLRGSYTLDEIDDALFSRGIPVITRPYVTTADGEFVELEYICFPPGKNFSLDDTSFMVFSAFWIWRDAVETRYQIIFEGRQRLLSGIIYEYEKRVRRMK